MRILLLAPQPFYQPRGTPIAVKQLVTSLTRQGHLVTILTPHEGDDVVIPGARIERLPAVPGTRGMPPGFSWKKVVSDVALAVACLRLLRREPYDLVHAVEEASFVALLARRLRGRPYVYDMDSCLSEQLVDRFRWLRPLQPLLSRVEGAAIRGSAGVLAVCPALEETARRHAPGVLAATAEDIALFEPGDEGASEEVAGELAELPGPRVLYVGNLERYQGIDLLLEAFARAAAVVPQARLVLVGGTEAHVLAYREHAVRLGIGDRVHLLGPRAPERLADYLREADVLVSPRVSGHNTPMKVYSYLAAGRAILATRLPTHTQVLDDSVARLVAPEPQAFADALVELLGDEASRRLLGARAAERAQREHGVAAFDAKVGRFYDELARRLDLAPVTAAAPWVAAR